MHSHPQVRRLVLRTTSIFLYAALWGALALSAAQKPAPPDPEPKLPADSLETQNGTLTVEVSPDDDTTFRALLDDKVLVEMEGSGATIAAHLRQGARDYLLLEISSGGTACPYEYQLVELAAKRAPVVSESFGSCGVLTDASYKGGKVVIRMPAYTPDPDLLTPAEVRRNDRTTYVYIWNLGTLEEKKVVGK